MSLLYNNTWIAIARILEDGKRKGTSAFSELCGELGMSSASLYKWHAKFGGMDASLITGMKYMAEQSRRLKRMYAEMSMQNDLLKEALGKKR